MPTKTVARPPARNPALRVALLPFVLLLLTACPPSDTGIIPDTGEPPPPTYEGIGPQTMVGTHHNFCAIIDGPIVCKGEGEADNYGLSIPPEGDEWLGLESNPRYLCAWNTMGELTCWGSPTTPLAEPPPNLHVADLRIGTAGGIALMLDGSLTLWGSDAFGQLSDAPDLVGPYIAVEAGYGWRCASDEFGELTCWGIEDGEGVAWVDHAQVTDAPTDRGFIGLNRGVGDVLSGIDTDGRVYSWGGGYEFTEPLNDVDAANVAPSDNYVCAHLPGGTLACQGDILAGELNPGDNRSQPITVVTDVACEHRVCGAVVEGEIVRWGAGQEVPDPVESGRGGGNLPLGGWAADADGVYLTAR